MILFFRIILTNFKSSNQLMIFYFCFVCVVCCVNACFYVKKDMQFEIFDPQEEKHLSVYEKADCGSINNSIQFLW